MKLFVCAVDDVRLLPHFLRHYERSGVTEFHVAAPRHLANSIESVSHNYQVIQYHDFDAVASFTGGAEAVTKMREIAQGAEEWVVIVDLDEFVEFPEPVTNLAEKVEAEGANIVRGIMYDRFAIDGQLKDFADDSDLSALFPVRARFRKFVMGGNEIKGVLVKGRPQELRRSPQVPRRAALFRDARDFTLQMERSRPRQDQAGARHVCGGQQPVGF